MVISARVHYACLALLELALRRDDPAPVAAGEITERHGIPGPFLIQILRTLRTAGWVESSRGSQGGYRLTADPSRITLLDVAEALGCQESRGKTEAMATAEDELLQEVWERAAEVSRQVLATTTLGDLVERRRHGESTMFYI